MTAPRSRFFPALVHVAVLGTVAATLLACGTAPEDTLPASVQAASDAAQVARGDYLVAISGCNHCHTPMAPGPNGPEPDMARYLSGHPGAGEGPRAPDLGDGPWQVVSDASNTAWSGPWGTSYSANLTPDPDTGLGRWSQEEFRQTLRAGRHRGTGRPLLPPMPVAVYQNLTTDDIDAIYAYLRTIKPLRNPVPAPLPPAIPGTPR